MSKKYKSTLVIDHADNVWLAKSLTRFYDKVYYCYPDWSCGFTEIAACELGSGFEGVEKVNFWGSVIDEVDSVIFTDVEFAGLAKYLQEQGYRVFGSGDVEELELDRGTFLESLKEVGLPVPKTTILKGFDELEKYLKGKEDVYVKLSHYRAIRETFHWVDDIESTSELMYIKEKVGCFKDEIEFYVQEPIESDYEWGFDSMTVHGKFPKSVQFGFEKKSCNYFGKQIKIADLDKSMQDVIEKYSKVLQKYDYTGFLSLEVRRAKDGTDYAIDLTPRIPLPAGASYLNMGTNWGDVIEGALDGNIIEVKTDSEYGVETIVTTDCNEYNPIRFDKKYEDNINPCVCAKRDGIIWRLPNGQLYNATNKCVFVTTQGDSLEKAIEENKEICNSLKGKGLSFDSDFSHVEKMISDLKTQAKIKF